MRFPAHKKRKREGESGSKVENERCRQRWREGGVEAAVVVVVVKSELELNSMYEC